MLNFLILTTRAILMAAIVGGAIWGYARRVSDGLEVQKPKKIVAIGALVGLVFAIVMTIFKNNTSRVSSSFWNTVIYVVSLVSLVLFLIFIRKKTLPHIFLAAYLSMLMLFSLPEVLGFPHQIILSEKTVISTDFLYEMIGVLGGILLAFVTFLAVEKCAVRLSETGARVLLIIELVLQSLRYLAGLFSVLLQEQIIRQNHTMFQFAVFIKNHTDELLFVSMAFVILISILLWGKSFRVNEPYKNPAEHRKIRAKWRNIRQWATVAVVTVCLGILNVTVVDAYNSQEVTLSPIEDAEFDDEYVYVPFELVSDGHLHRFGYESENGVTVRFIVIQKPNSSSYGVGLDACDICGETGYYERDGQVICSLCDVVMNISTIGFKGGCNPIVIPYEIKNGQILVPIKGLLEYESEFK